MPLAQLDEDERKVVIACLQAAVKGPFFPMWEFQTLFGLEHQEVENIAFGDPPLDDTQQDVQIAINNSLNMLTGYPHKCGEEVWEQFISVSPDEVRRIFKKMEGNAIPSPIRS